MSVTATSRAVPSEFAKSSRRAVDQPLALDRHASVNGRRGASVAVRRGWDRVTKLGSRVDTMDSSERATPPVVVRFGVAASDGRRSMSWRVWTGARHPTDEVYVAPRHMAGDLKFSAHSSGYAQIGPTRRLRSRSSPDDRAAFSRAAVGTAGERVVLCLLFHRSELRVRTPDVDEATVELRDDEDALLLLVAVGPPSCQLPPGFRIAGAVAQQSSDPVLLIAGPSTPTPLLLTEALEALAAPYETWRMPVEWTYESHGVVVAEDESDGPPLLVEFAVDEAPPWRLPAAVEAFAGDVLSFDRLPVPVREDVDVCAAVWIGDAGQRRLYVNEGARCDHEHLLTDVAGLVAEFERSGPDAGWTRLDGAGGEQNTGWITAIATSAAAARRDAAPSD